ncbi:hypothetical protein [Streptomyces albipurpureus]|uniref:Uncharacterized protein n=1 Tax=Streptomyces albipurpureus TaxID=2897419 RepID=A0ABT0UZR4_9ACTN|nr:hypothetical protein [Streptomyces sp. CWNU-1]MCM2394072.1 hypothetical protein [Streptomyces sp. CWNU-1]
MKVLLAGLGPAKARTRRPGGPRELPVLQHKDLAERPAEISADTGPGGCPRFRELDYDSAVRTHFWDRMPDLRQHRGTWSARSMDPNDPHVTPGTP